MKKVLLAMFCAVMLIGMNSIANSKASTATKENASNATVVKVSTAPISATCNNAACHDCPAAPSVMVNTTNNTDVGEAALGVDVWQPMALRDKYNDPQGCFKNTMPANTTIAATCTQGDGVPIAKAAVNTKTGWSYTGNKYGDDMAAVLICTSYTPG